MQFLRSNIRVMCAVACLGLWLTVGAPAPCWAQSPVSDVLTVFDPTGAIAGQVGVHEDGTVFGLHSSYFHNSGPPPPPNSEDPGGIYFIAVSGLAIGGTPVTFDEPGQSNGFSSDIAGTGNVGGLGTILAFASDTETIPQPFGTGGSIVVPEPNGPYDMTRFLDPVLQRQGFTANFISESEVPEPGSLALLAGLLVPGAALLYCRRKTSR